MDLSLDDIIKKNRTSKQLQKKKKPIALNIAAKSGPKPKAGGKIAKKLVKQPISNNKPRAALLDARSRIINKNRVKIRDAREKIAENSRKSFKDARELLTPKKPIARAQKKIAIPKGRALQASKAAVIADSDEDEDFDMEDLKMKPVASLKRTVRNDMFRTVPPLSMPKPPKFNINPDIGRESPDPFDCYQLPPRRPAPVPPMRPEPLVRGYQPGRSMSAHMDAYPPKSILRTSQFDDHDDRFESDRYFASLGPSKDTVRSRLYNESRERNSESAGIFAKLPVRSNSPPPNQVGHRIVISNLHKSVTQSDVRELFEDIGALVTATLVRPGTAEVIYKNLNDAEEAVETYHNRQLDGMAMKCMLVPSASSKRPSYSSRM